MEERILVSYLWLETGHYEVHSLLRAKTVGTELVMVSKNETNKKLIVHSKSQKHIQRRGEALNHQGQATVEGSFAWQERMIRIQMSLQTEEGISCSKRSSSPLLSCGKRSSSPMLSCGKGSSSPVLSCGKRSSSPVLSCGKRSASPMLSCGVEL